MSLRASVARILLLRYFRAKKLKLERGAQPVTAYYWERPTWAKPPNGRHGRACPVDSEALGTDLAAAIGKAELLNQHFEEWRLGVDAKPAEGAVKALFGWYRTLDRFKQLGARSMRDYRHYMSVLESFQLKTTTFGQRRAAEIEARHVDSMYLALLKTRGKRAAAYCMQVAKRVWNEAIRHKKLKGPNPFEKMGLDMRAAKGNRETSRAEYDACCAQARAMGIQSMATAAALSFELVRRVTDVFGYTFGRPEPECPLIAWEDYEPRVKIALRQHKTGDAQIIPLRGDPDPDSPDEDVRLRGQVLYPSLEEELARMKPGKGHIVIDEENGKRYEEQRAQRVLRKIRKAAGLPAGMTLTGFRHGGATELGDAGVLDIRPISGHRTLEQPGTYNKASQAKARTAGAKRLEHVRKGNA
jgi:hypothetical protein